MIFVIGGVKGGSGKSTLATNLTVVRSADRRVLLVDADEQRSSADWAEHRENLGIETPWTTITLDGSTVGKQLEKMKANYDEIIVDVGGRDSISQRSALSVADVFLVPFQPRTFDIWTYGKVKSLIESVQAINPGLVSVAVINRADPNKKDLESAFEILHSAGIELLDTKIGQRKSFSNAAAEGLGVVELKPQNKQASAEIHDLCREIFV